MTAAGGRRHTRHAIALCLGIAISTAALICVPVAGAASRPKPDLVVKGFQFKSTPPHESNSLRHVVLENDRHGQFGLVYKIKNVGKKRAHKSTVRIVINGRKFADEQVGPIPPGGSITVRENYNPRFRGPGKFSIFVCADFEDQINEANEHNNCTPNVEFHAIPRRWDVNTFTTGPNSLTGDAPFFAAQSAGITFDYYGVVAHEGDKYFLWLATGGVTGQVSGDDGFCTYSGDGSVSHSPWDVIPPEVGYLEINPKLDGYFAEVEDQDYSFVGTQTCPGYPPYESDTLMPALETNDAEGRADQPTSPGATTLAGSYTIPTGYGTGSTNGQWSFKADLLP